MLLLYAVLVYNRKMVDPAYNTQFKCCWYIYMHGEHTCTKVQRHDGGDDDGNNDDGYSYHKWKHNTWTRSHEIEFEKLTTQRTFIYIDRAEQIENRRLCVYCMYVSIKLSKYTHTHTHARDFNWLKNLSKRFVLLSFDTHFVILLHAIGINITQRRAVLQFIKHMHWHTRGYEVMSNSNHFIHCWFRRLFGAL